MREVYLGDLRKVVIHHYREIEALNPEYQSTEWFLLRYLKRIEKSIDASFSQHRVENCMRGFIRFYVDTVETNSPLGERCIKIYEEYRKALKVNQEG